MPAVVVFNVCVLACSTSLHNAQAVANLLGQPSTHHHILPHSHDSRSNPLAVCVNPSQAPDLTLVPAVAAPGAYINVKTMTDDSTYVSGTSFSSPYTAGLIAMWLQVRRAFGDTSGHTQYAAVLMHAIKQLPASQLDSIWSWARCWMRVEAFGLSHYALNMMHMTTMGG